MIVEEKGIKYNIDEATGIVSVATASDLANNEVIVIDESDEIRLHSRVDVDGESGTVVSLTPSLYGLAYGVKFDNGDVDEFPEELLKSSSVAQPDYESPVHEVLQRFSSYENLPTFTNDELHQKETEARWLNLRAKSLATNSKLALSDQNDLGRIVLVTGTDLVSIKELLEQSEESQAYLNAEPKFSISQEINGHGAVMGQKGDASWLMDALDGMEIVETTDADLAARATEMVAAFSKEQLEDDGFMRLAASYQHEYLQMDETQQKQFDSMVERARQTAMGEVVPPPKTASTDIDLDGIDDSAIFLS